MRRIFPLLILACMASLAWGAPTMFNPFTGKPDFVGQSDWNASSGAGAILNKPLTVGDLLSYGYVFHLRSDSAACDVNHPMHATALTTLAGWGLDASNIACDSGFPATNTVTLTGVSATGATGTLTASVSSIATLLDAYGTGAAGNLGLSVANGVALTGSYGTGAAGDIGVAGSGIASLLGAYGSGAAGSLDVASGASGNATANLAGANGTGAAGDLTVAGAGVLALLGADGTGAAGVLTVSVAGDGTVTLTGGNGTGAAGTLTVAGTRSATATLTGTNGTGAAGTLAVSGGGGAPQTTFYPSADGAVTNFAAGVGWVAARSSSAGTSASSTSATEYVESDFSIDEEETPTSVLSRAFMAFDLSGAAGTIATATLYFTATADITGSAKVSVQQGNQSIPLTTADFDSVTLDSGTFGQTSAAVTTSGEKSVTLNASGVSYLQSVIGGTAKLCLRNYENDYLNSEPAGDVWAQIYMVEQGGAERPRLVLTYE